MSGQGETRPTIRLDKWLWQARFFKSRSLAAAVVTGGKLRIDGTPAAKPARAVGPGDVLTFIQEKDTRVVRILACGTRRGPAPGAQALYEDLTPPKPVQETQNVQSANPAYDGKGRPTKRDWRNMQSHRGDDGALDLE